METPRRKSRWLRRLVVFFLFAVGAFIYSRQFHPELEDVAGQRAQLGNRDKAERAWRIDALALLNDVKTLSAPAMQGRAVGTPGGKLARDYIARRLVEIGLEPAFGRSFEQPFQFTPGRGIRFWGAKFWQAPVAIPGVNLAALVRGTVDPGHYLVVSAHYDHLGIRNGKLYPGADDNASGVGAMLAAARWFRDHPPRHSILFVAFDGEEKGLRGARAFVDKPPVPLAAMLVDINFDMVSRNPAGEIFLTGLYANPQLKPLLDPVRAQAVPTILYGHDYPRPFWNTDDWTDQSDQGAFASRGLPFIYLGVEDHPDYHQPGDTFEHIDQKFYTGVADAIIDVISALDAADAKTLRKGA
ncbi:MAG: M20/M25/M40 family metallo-hydrolase [Arenimonas sp.]